MGKIRVAPKASKLTTSCWWYGTRIRCQRPWNVKSRMRKARSSPTQTWIAWGKLVQLRSFTFLQCTSSIYDSVTITISEFKGTDFGRRRRFLLRRFCILQIIGPRSHLDSMWLQFAWHTSDKAKEPRRVARAKDMENFIEELHTWPWHTELRTECTQGWFRSP